jgi:hypothetical protein
MYDPSRRLPTVIAAVLVAVAIAGYVAGHGRSATAAPQKIRSVPVGSVLVGAPADWQQAAAPPAIPGLPIIRPVVLAPHGDAKETGFLTGQLRAGAPSPLPAQLLAQLPAVPRTEVVNLVESQAYRYSGLTVPGFAPVLTVYAIPNPGGDQTVVACYAPKPVSADMATCERIVATLTLVGHTQSYDLTPEPGYARQLSRAIGAVDGQRVALRREMHQGAALSTVQALAARIADGFAKAGTSLSLLEPPLVAARAQKALRGSISQARDAYTALADAAGTRSAASYNAARATVDEAEARVSRALENFATLGYG